MTQKTDSIRGAKHVREETRLEADTQMRGLAFRGSENTSSITRRESRRAGSLVEEAVLS